MKKLESIYSDFGYTRYKMSKFEEYELYAKNKDFLLSENVLTFTDVSGKLMALKPDVTLSIIKNSADCKDGVTKVYYNENVYRVSKDSNSFREIKQLGLECIGDIGNYEIAEVLHLAAESLRAISDEYVLSVSNMDVVTELLSSMGLSKGETEKVLFAISSKSLHEVESICKAADVDVKKIDKLKALVSTYGKPSDVINDLKAWLPESEALLKLELITSALPEDSLRIDFSVLSDTNYYNGIVFKGFVAGIPESIISGGQYDKLMVRMKRTSKALGFAVYVDAIPEDDKQTLDTDVLVLYKEGDDIKEIFDVVKAQGDKTVTVLKSIPENFTFEKLIEVGGQNNA